MIKSQSYLIKNNQIITNEVLSSYVTRFWNEVYASLVPNNEVKHLMILCKVQYSDSETTNSKLYKTLGPLRRVGIQDKELFITFLTERLGILIESYNPQSISKIVFTYVIKEGAISTTDRNLLQDLTDKDLPIHVFNKIKLPISMNPADYGKVLVSSILDGFTRYIVTNNKRIFQIDVSLNKAINNVTILGGSDLKWTDRLLNDGSFKREIGKTTLYFLDGEVILQKKELNAKSFKRFRRRN
jgi:hypothetical protein